MNEAKREDSEAGRDYVGAANLFFKLFGVESVR